MTYKQGEDINKRFISLSDSLRIATDSLIKLNNKYKYSMVLTGIEFQDVYNQYNRYLNANKFYISEVDRLQLAIKNHTVFAAVSLGIMFLLLAKYR